MLLAKERHINPFFTHANLIGLHLEGKNTFEGYLQKLVQATQDLNMKRISVYDIDREMSKVVIFLAFKSKDRVPAKSASDYDSSDWLYVKKLLLSNAYA